MDGKVDAIGRLKPRSREIFRGIVNHSRVVVLAISLASVMLFVPGVAVAEGGETAAASKMVRSTIDEILLVLANQEGSDDARIKSIESVVFSNFDFETISRLVLARNFKRFSADQQAEFERLFKVYLSRSYGRRLLRYKQEAVELIKARRESRGDVTVMTKIVGGQADKILMNYRARQRGEAWKVIDVTIEGVSLVSNYRSQFKEMVSKVGPEGLIARLRDKTFVAPEDEK